MLIAFIIMTMLLFGLLLAACVRIEDAQQQVRDALAERKANALQYTDTLLTIMQERTEADLLRRLADRWESTDEQPNLARLAREKYQPGGPSMPAIWLRAEADKIDGKESA